MREMKKIKIYLVMMLAVMMLVGVNAQTTQAAEKINKKKIVLVKKKKYTLKIKGTTNKVKWSSSNKAVATVAKDGKVTGKKKGTAIVTGKVNNKKYTCKVKVQSKYTNSQLEKMVHRYLKANNLVGDRYYLSISSEEGNEVLFHAYAMDVHWTQTIGWYSIDRRTGKGMDTIFFKKIDFSKYAN